MIHQPPTKPRDTHARAEALFAEMEHDLDMSPYIIDKLKYASGFTPEGLRKNNLFAATTPKAVIYHWYRMLKDSTPNRNALPAVPVLEDMLLRHGLPEDTDKEIRLTGIQKY
jgi:hypothetical protein